MIGNTPATMYLQKTGKEYHGYYYYDRVQIPIKLGDAGLPGNGDSVHIAAWDQEISESLDGRITEPIFAGTWATTIGEQTTSSLPFSFTENKTVPAPYFDMVYTTYETEFPGGLEKGSNPGYDYFAATLWPMATTPVSFANFFKQWVNVQFGNKNSSLPIGKFFINEKNRGLASWKKEISGVKKEAFKDLPSSYSRSTERRLLVMYQNEKYLSIADYSYEFSGGAHGNGGSTMHTLDIKNNKELKLADILMPATKHKVEQLLDAAVRVRFHIAKTAKLSSDEGGELLVKKVELTENFYLTGKGIGFNYTPYEIAAYAYGEVNLFIPYSKLKGLLRPGLGE